MIPTRRAALLILLASCGGPPSRPSDGRTVTDPSDFILRGDDSEVRALFVDDRGVGRSVRLEPPVEFRWTAPVAKPAADEIHVTLAAGYRLAGRLERECGTGLLLKSRVLGDRWIRSSRIRAIQFDATAADEGGRGPEWDTILQRSGGRLEGTVLFVTPDAVHLHERGAGKDIRVTRPAISAVLLAPVDRPPEDPSPWVGIVETADGSSLRGEVPRVAAGRMTFTDVFGLAYDLPLADVRRIRVEERRAGGGRSSVDAVERPSRKAPISGGGPYELVRTIESAGGFAFHPDEGLFLHYSSRDALDLLSTRDWRRRWSAPIWTRPGLTSAEVRRSVPGFASKRPEVVAQLRPGELSVLDVETGSEVRKIGLEEVTDGVEVMPFSAGRVLINGGGRCWILLPEMRHPYALASAHQGRAGAEGDWLVGLCQAGYDRGGEGGLLSYDLRTLKAARGVPLAGPVKGMAIPADASRIFVVGFVPPWDLRVHDLRTFREVSRQPLGGDEPSILAASPDGSRLAVATENGGLGIYRAADLSIEESLQLWSKARSVAFSPSGRYLAVQLETVTHIFERK